MKKEEFVNEMCDKLIEYVKKVGIDKLKELSKGDDDLFSKVLKNGYFQNLLLHSIISIGTKEPEWFKVWEEEIREYTTNEDFSFDVDFGVCWEVQAIVRDMIEIPHLEDDDCVKINKYFMFMSDYAQRISH